MILPAHYLLLAAWLFVIGVCTVLVRRHPLVVLLGIELALQAANLAFAALAGWFQDWNGQIMLLILIALATVECVVGVGFALRHIQTQKTERGGDQKEWVSKYG